MALARLAWAAIGTVLVAAACGDSDGDGDAGAAGSGAGSGGAMSSGAGGRAGAGGAAGAGGRASSGGSSGSAPAGRDAAVDAGRDMSVASLVEIASTGALTCELGCRSIGGTCAAACMGQEISLDGQSPANVAGVAWYHERFGSMVIEVPVNIRSCAADVAIGMSGLRTSLECCCEGGSADAGPGGEPTDCSTQTTCEGCQGCAEAGACFDPYFECKADAQCGAFRTCLRECTDASCLDTCTLAFPNGSFLLADLSDCLCVACSAQCGGAGAGCAISL